MKNYITVRKSPLTPFFKQFLLTAADSQQLRQQKR